MADYPPILSAEPLLLVAEEINLHSLGSMRDDQHRFLMIHGQLPMRLSIQQASWVLNCGEHDISVLMAARLLKPLGNPPHTGSKYFATREILELAGERAWLVKMTNALYQFWRTKNAGRKKTGSTVSQRTDD